MTKISELIREAGITGTEIIPAVKDPDTPEARTVAFPAGLLAAQVEVQADRAEQAALVAAQKEAEIALKVDSTNAQLETLAANAEDAEAKSQAWAEGILPGGAGTKSAKEHALAVEATVQSIGPVASAFIMDEAIAAGQTYLADRMILNGQTFTTLHARVTAANGDGSVELVVLVNGVAEYGPETIDTVGRTDAIDIAAPIGADVEFSFFSVSGDPVVVFVKMVGAAA